MVSGQWALYLMNSSITLINLNRVKLRWAVTFMRYIAHVVSLIFLAKTLIWNKITFPASNLLNLAELVVNEPMKSITWGKQMHSYYAPCFYRTDFVVIPSYVELPWYQILFTQGKKYSVTWSRVKYYFTEGE